MVDDRPKVAQEIVAREVIRRALDTGYPTAPEWDNYPEIGENDWHAIEAIIDRWRDQFFAPPTEEYEAAYGYLDARADAE